MKNDFYLKKESVDQYIEMAKDVNGGDLIKKLKQFLSPCSTLLEIGSGPGTDWKILNKDYNVVGSDNSPEFLKRLIVNNKDGTFMRIDAITLDTNLMFDGIYSNKVLHHLTDKELKLSIKKQFDILNRNGVICHSFWKGEGTEIFNGLFINNHKEDDLRGLFNDLFDILLIESYAEFEEGDSILIIAKKKL